MKPLDEIDIHYQPPAEIRQQKLNNFTITLIGGPAEYKAYMVEKEIRLARQKVDQNEAYLLKRSFAADIIMGIGNASSEALATPATLRRYQNQIGIASLVDAPPREEPATPPPPPLTWYQKIKSYFARGTCK